MKKLFILILVFLSLIVSVNSATLINQSSQTGTLANLVNGSYSAGQSFNYSSSSTYYNVSQIGLIVAKIGSPSGNAILGLYTTNSTGHPQSLICNNSISASSISASVGFAYFPTTCNTLNVSQQYTLTLNCPNCSGGNYVQVRYQNTNAYANGVMFDYYVSSVNSWTAYTSATGDIGFSIVGTESNATIPPVLTFSNISLVNNTYFNTTNIQINTTILNTSTNGNVNQTAYLYYATNGTFINSTQYATNNISGTLNYNSLTDNIYKIWFRGFNNATNVTIGNYTFTKDTTSPTITNNISSEYNYYNITGFNSSCTDTNLLYCNITINSQTIPLNTTTFNFTANGNMSYTITAVDLAGNTATSTGVTLVNPYAFFYFNSTGGFISNFTFGGENITGYYANFTIYNDVLSLGSNTLTFSKLGYATTDVTFSVTTTSIINLTTNITQSTITLNIYDRETGALISPSTSYVSLVATTGYNTTTTTGQVNITNVNFIEEEYQVLVSNANYNSEYTYFNYDNQELINISIYLIALNSTDAGYVIINAMQFGDEARINGAYCYALEWKPIDSAFSSVATGKTNINGETILNIELTSKLYKFSCSKDSVTAYTDSQVILTTGTIIPIILGSSTINLVPNYQNLEANLTNTTLNASHERIRFSWDDENLLTTQGCIKIYHSSQSTWQLNSTTCDSSSNSFIVEDINVNTSYNIKVEAYLIYQTITIPIDTLQFKGSGSLQKALDDYNLDIILPLILFVLGFSIGLMIKPQILLIGLFGGVLGSWLGFVLVPTIMSITLVLFINLVIGVIIWATWRAK